MESESRRRRQRDRRKSAYDTRSIDICIAVSIIALIVVIGIVCYAATRAIRDSALKNETLEDRVLAEEPLTVTKTPSGKTLSTYVITDPDTGIQWIIAPNGSLVQRGEIVEEDENAESYDAY